MNKLRTLYAEKSNQFDRLMNDRNVLLEEYKETPKQSLEIKIARNRRSIQEIYDYKNLIQEKFDIEFEKLDNQDDDDDYQDLS